MFRLTEIESEWKVGCGHIVKRCEYHTKDDSIDFQGEIKSVMTRTA